MCIFWPHMPCIMMHVEEEHVHSHESELPLVTSELVTGVGSSSGPGFRLFEGFIACLSCGQSVTSISVALQFVTPFLRPSFCLAQSVPVFSTITYLSARQLWS